jgi:uncharacterized protein (TIGR02118 family)
MVKITALFGHPADPAAFEEFYMNNHRPLVDKIPNLQRFEAAKIVAMPDGSELSYYWIAELCLSAWSRCRAAWARRKDRQQQRIFKPSPLAGRGSLSLR